MPIIRNAARGPRGINLRDAEGRHIGQRVLRPGEVADIPDAALDEKPTEARIAAGELVIEDAASVPNGEAGGAAKATGDAATGDSSGGAAGGAAGGASGDASTDQAKAGEEPKGGGKAPARGGVTKKEG